MKQSQWLNNKKIIEPKVSKPCHAIGYCPFGALVEEFPLRMKRNKFSCDTFGHDCPAFYLAEGITE